MSDLPVKRFKRKRRRRDNPRREMTFLEHLGELRGRLIISVVTIVLTTAIGGGFLSGKAIDLITLPYGGIDRVKEDLTLRLRLEQDGTFRAANQEELLSLLGGKGDAKPSRDGETPSGSDNENPADGSVANPQDPATTASAIFVDGADMDDRKIKRGWIRVEASDGTPLFVVGPQRRGQFLATTPFAAFFLWIKVAVIIGIVFALPVWMYQLWLFVAPALTTVERRAIRPVLLAGIFLFPMGVSCAYGMLYIVMKFALRYTERFLFIQLWPDISKYLSFVLTFMTAFGFVFELPLVLVLLVRMGVIGTEKLRKSRPYAVVIMAVSSALLTPADPFSMMAMFVPMILLFEISLGVARMVERRVQAGERKMAAESGESESTS